MTCIEPLKNEFWVGYTFFIIEVLDLKRAMFIVANVRIKFHLVCLFTSRIFNYIQGLYFILKLEKFMLY